MSLALRYTRGEYDAVWTAYSSRLACEDDYVNDPDCAALTFAILTRMRRNVDTIIACLSEGGYEFVAPSPRVATPDMAMTALRKAQAPFTVIAFAEIVGTVDLRAAHFEGEAAEGLGRYDPLVFYPAYFAQQYRDKDWRADQEAETPGQMRCEFAPDVFHKANVSGGDGYSFLLPSPSADPIVSPLDVPFLEYVRGTIEQGGFWGISGPVYEAQDWEGAAEIAKGRRLPDNALLRTIRSKLQPF